MTETIVPFLNPAAKQANDILLERMRGVPANVPSANMDDVGGNPNVDAITELLRAMEGMQSQVQALTDLVIQQDKRIRELEKAGKSKIIKVMS